jgi:hypothetical protein
MGGDGEEDVQGGGGEGDMQVGEEREVQALLGEDGAAGIEEAAGREEVVGRKVRFDEILADLGDFGRYQKLAYFLLFLPTIFSAMQKQSWWVVMAREPVG